MNRTEELEQLRQYLEFGRQFQNNPHLVAQFERAIDEMTPLYLKDQYDAAKNEARADFIRGLPEPDGQDQIVHGSNYVTDLNAYIMAAVSRCLAGDRCKHAVYGNRTMIAFLAIRLITCKKCLPQFIDKIEQHDRETAQDTDARRDECDLCLNKAEGFYTLRSSWGQVFLMGDACSDCRDMVREHGAVSGIEEGDRE